MNTELRNTDESKFDERAACGGVEEYSDIDRALARLPRLLTAEKYGLGVLAECIDIRNWFWKK